MENTPQTAGVARVRLQRGRPGLLVHTLPCSTRAHAQTRPDVGLREQGPACGSGRCCGATRVCPRACMCVHREAQARSSVGTSSASEGPAGSPGTCPGQSPLLEVAPCGKAGVGEGRPPSTGHGNPGGGPGGRGPGLLPPPSCLESGRPPAQGWALHTQWRRRTWALLPWRREPREQQQQGPGRGEPPLSGAEWGRGAAGPRSSGRQQLALQPSAAGPLCTGRRAPGPAISRASPPSTRRCSSRCSPRPGEASVGERPGS